MNAPLDHTNYEAWLLDRLEGRLTSEQERELDAFLARYPQLVPDEWALPGVPMTTISLGAVEKEALKRSIPPVGKVDRSTVEDHLIARLEGDLDQQQLEALRAYLIAHPKWLHAERTFTLTKLVPEAMAFAAKHELERHFPPKGMPTVHTLEDHLIARLEGDLSPEQERALDRLLAQDKAHEQTWSLVRATRIEAAPVRFSGKEALKKREGRVIPISFGSWPVRLAAAASVAILIAVGLWYLRTPDGTEEQIARVPTTSTERMVKDGIEVVEIDPIPANEENGASNAPDVQQEEAVNDAGPRTTPSPRQVEPPRPELNRAHPSVEPGLQRNDPQLAQEKVPVNDPPSPPDPMQLPVASTQEPTQLAHTNTPATSPAIVSAGNERTLGDVLAGALRERVLDAPERSNAPLDGNDAVAVVDRTLKAVGGAHAGLDLERKGNGGLSRLNLRLGRNLSISASR